MMVVTTDTAWKGKAGGRQRNGIRQKLKRVTAFVTNPRTIGGRMKEGKHAPKKVSLAKISITLLLFCGIYGPRALPVPKPNPQIEQDTWMQKWCEDNKSGGYLCKEDR